MLNLLTEFDFFKAHQADLVKKYNGKVLAIKGDQILGAFESEADALKNAVRQAPIGTFLVQRCIPGPDAYTAHFSSPRFA